MYIMQMYIMQKQSALPNLSISIIHTSITKEKRCNDTPIYTISHNRYQLNGKFDLEIGAAAELSMQRAF